MNRKLLAAVIIPMLLVPLASFAYAHWSDTIFKRYKFRFGSVEVEILKWHVDLVRIADADSDFQIFGDELNITEVYDAEQEVIGLLILADPVGPGFELWLSMLIHNKGRLPVVIEGPRVAVSMLYVEDPGFGPIPGNETVAQGFWDPINQTWVQIGDWPPWLNYQWWYYRHELGSLGKGDYNVSRYTWPVNPTAWTYEPSEAILVTQRIVLDVQPAPYLQLLYFRIDVQIPLSNADATATASYQGGPLPWIEEPID
ncbi:MAG: hypothetical protein ACE5J6_01800 [Candidatus Bathyarchaeia archaeon]